jgi:general secretion pathway protein I
MRAERAARGFGLLEAIVALTLLASTGLALFTWINQSLSTAQRLREHERDQQWRQLAAAWLQTVDPQAQPSGEAEPVPGLRLRWSSRPLMPQTAVPPWPGGNRSSWAVRLYAVEAQYQADDLSRPGQLTVQRLSSQYQAPHEEADSP